VRRGLRGWQLEQADLFVHISQRVSEWNLPIAFIRAGRAAPIASVRTLRSLQCNATQHFAGRCRSFCSTPFCFSLLLLSPGSHTKPWHCGCRVCVCVCVCVCSHMCTTNPLSQHSPLTFMPVMDRLVSLSHSFLSFSFCADTALFKKLW